MISRFVCLKWMILIHDVNPSVPHSSVVHFTDLSLKEALLDARRDTVTHRATMDDLKIKSYGAPSPRPIYLFNF